MSSKYETHPSWGLAVFHRASGTGKRLYGSELRHHETIRFQLTVAKETRDLSQEWRFSGEVLFEVEFTPAQFAQLLTTMNVGSGVPCTIDYRIDLGRQKYEASEAKDEKFKQELSQDEQAIYAHLNELEAHLDLVKMTVKDRDSLKGRVAKVKQIIRSGIPFVVSQYRDHMEKVVTDAKAQVEAFVTGVVTRTGLEALRKQAPQLAAAETVKALPDGTECEQTEDERTSKDGPG